MAIRTLVESIATLSKILSMDLGTSLIRSCSLLGIPVGDEFLSALKEKPVFTEVTKMLALLTGCNSNDIKYQFTKNVLTNSLKIYLTGLNLVRAAYETVAISIMNLVGTLDSAIRVQTAQVDTAESIKVIYELRSVNGRIAILFTVCSMK